MSKLSFQEQGCSLTLEQGLEEYRGYLQANGKKQLSDPPGSTIIRDHDVTHVIFGLDTSLEQESLLDSWVLMGTQWKLKDFLAYNKLPEFKELYKYLIKEVSYFRLFLMFINLIPLKLKVRKKAKQMNKKWPFVSPDDLLARRVCDLRDEYGIKILLPEERVIEKPLMWSGSIHA